MSNHETKIVTDQSVQDALLRCDGGCDGDSFDGLIEDFHEYHRLMEPLSLSARSRIVRAHALLYGYEHASDWRNTP